MNPNPPRDGFDTPEVDEARDVIEGRELRPPSEYVRLARSLRAQFAYEMAREMIDRVLDRPEVKADRDAVYQLRRIQVTCTYKDMELSPERTLADALRLLREARFDPDDPANTDSEMLSLAGAIYKRWWEYDGQTEHLERALAYYTRAYAGNVATADGYPAVNAAYLLDVLASLDLPEVAPSGAPVAIRDPRVAEARGIREQIVQGVAERADYWVLVTLAEAHLGLDRLSDATRLLAEAVKLSKTHRREATGGAEAQGVEDWQIESTVHQLASLARVHANLRRVPFDESLPAWAAVRDALGGQWTAGVHSAFIGRVGLALSGGGFRASLYHVGVLARLAELDVLRHVEVISCVSGGSIIGARYYLEVRRLLQEKTDAEITRADYIHIVEKISADFLRGVQTNLRTRLLADREANRRSVQEPGYSRTERLGEMFEEVLYAGVGDEDEGQPRWLNKLYVKPAGHTGRPFNPRLENWRRNNKVPVLVLNATTLNTGHTWQFTASWMGETPGSHDAQIGGTPLLPRIRYSHPPAGWGKVRLGRAVAASACVPGLFDPVELVGAYPGRTVRLADGGVYDNQGTATLLAQNCTLLLVSDASGQLRDEEHPAANPLGVSSRANNVLMARVREAQYAGIDRLLRAGILRGLLYVHLRQDLPGVLAESSAPRSDAMTRYGMRQDVQARLATLRTDLDAFSDLESYALMESAYLATDHFCPPSLKGGAPGGAVGRHAWTFRKVGPLVARAAGPQEVFAQVCAHLDEGAATTLRGLRLPNARRTLMLGAAGALPGLTWRVVRVLRAAGAQNGKSPKSLWQMISGELMYSLGPTFTRLEDGGMPAYLQRGDVDALLRRLPR